LTQLQPNPHPLNVIAPIGFPRLVIAPTNSYHTIFSGIFLAIGGAIKRHTVWRFIAPPMYGPYCNKEFDS